MTIELVTDCVHFKQEIPLNEYENYSFVMCNECGPFVCALSYGAQFPLRTHLHTHFCNIDSFYLPTWVDIQLGKSSIG